MVRPGTAREHRRMVHRSSPGVRLLAVSLVLGALVSGCAQPSPASPESSADGVGRGPASHPAGASSTPSPVGPSTPAAPPPTAPGAARLQPVDGALFGLNLDWGNETAAAAADSLGRTPAVWVQFAQFPLDEASVAHLDAFIEQVAGVGGQALITLEPHGGLSTVTDVAAAELADLLAGYWVDHGVPTFVRFAHEMNGSWYPWSQQPAAYIDAFRLVADAVHRHAPASAMVWAPNQGGGYPFGGGAHAAPPGSVHAAALDTDGDGLLGATDDPYAPYYPGDDAVDWVGVSLYHWGRSYPWGENELPLPGTFPALLRGTDLGAHGTTAAVPDLYADYAEARDKPLAIVETAILYDPSTPEGPSEAQLKTAWFEQVFGPATREDFPRIGMLSWFEWRKHEPEVGRVIDWRLAADPLLARSLLDGVAPGWLRFATP